MLWRLLHIFVVFSLVLATIYVPVIVHETGDYSTPITIAEQSGTDLYNYTVKIVLNSTNWDGWSYTSDDGSDIYFMDGNGNPLYYWVKYFNKTEPNYAGSDYITVGIKPSSYGGSPLEVWVYADGTWYKGVNFRVEDDIPKADFSLMDIGGKTITRVALRHSSSGWSDPTDVWIWDANGNQLYHTTANSHTWDQSFPDYFEYVNVNYQVSEPEIIGYGKAIIWVKVPNIPANGTTTIYMYYGGANPYSSYNDPSKVFLFYDDFNENSLDTSKWTLNRWTGSDTYSATVASGYVEIYSGEQTAAGIVSNIGFNLPITIEGSWMAVSGTEMWIALTHVSGGSDDDWIRTGYVISGTYYYQKRVSGTITTYQSFSRSTPTSFTRFTWVVTPDKAIYYEEEQQVNTITTQDRYSTETLYLQLFTWNTGTARWDWIAVRKYVDPEPSVSIGSSEALGGVSIEGVSPSSVYAGTGDSVSINVTLNNTYSYDVDVTVKLIDHDNNVRDEVNATVPANNTYNVSLSTILTENDIGDHTWTISVYNASDNSLLDSCSVSVSVFNRTIEITAVDPSSISGEPNDTVTVNVTVKSTLLWTVTVNISLIDHNDVVRDYVETAIDPDQVLTVSLSTTLAEEDRGEWVWRIRVYNETTTFSSHSLNASIHYNLSYTFSYTLDFSLAYNVSEVIASRFNYTLQPSASLTQSEIETNGYTYSLQPLSSLNVSEVETYTPYPMIWGTKYCLDLYTNNTGDWSLEYHECGAYVYVLYINIYYIIESPYPDLVYNYISIRDYDTDQIVTYMYIPHGNTSRTVFSDKYYTLEIPLNGTTPHGYKYELVKYVVDGVENPDIIYVDNDKTIDIYFRIYEEETGGNDGGNGGDGGGGDGEDSTPPQDTFSPPPPVSFGEVDVSGVLPPVFSVGSPSLYSPQGILVLAFFIGLFIVYSRELSWGQALVLASGLSMIISVILVGITLVPLFMVLFIVGIGMWKILGK